VLKSRKGLDLEEIYSGPDGRILRNLRAKSRVRLEGPGSVSILERAPGRWAVETRAGTAQTLHFSMEVLANQGWKGHVTVSTSGSFPAAVTPNAFDLSGGTQPLTIDVSVPASAKPGRPEGGDCQAARALYALLAARYG